MEEASVGLIDCNDFTDVRVEIFRTYVIEPCGMKKEEA